MPLSPCLFASISRFTWFYYRSPPPLTQLSDNNIYLFTPAHTRPVSGRDDWRKILHIHNLFFKFITWILLKWQGRRYGLNGHDFMNVQRINWLCYPHAVWSIGPCMWLEYKPDGQTPWMSCNHGHIALTKKMAFRENDYIKAVRGQVNGKCSFVGSGYDQVPTGQSNSQQALLPLRGLPEEGTACVARRNHWCMRRTTWIACRPPVILLWIDAVYRNSFCWLRHEDNT